jgi:hypothetical protein
MISHFKGSCKWKGTLNKAGTPGQELMMGMITHLLKNQKEMKEKVTKGELLEKMVMKLDLPHIIMVNSRLQEEWEMAWQAKERLQAKSTLSRLFSLKWELEV